MSRSNAKRVGEAGPMQMAKWHGGGKTPV